MAYVRGGRRLATERRPKPERKRPSRTSRTNPCSDCCGAFGPILPVVPIPRQRFCDSQAAVAFARGRECHLRSNHWITCSAICSTPESSKILGQGRKFLDATYRSSVGKSSRKCKR